MLTFCYATYITYHNGKELGREQLLECDEEEDINKNTVIDFCWNNLKELYRQYGLVVFFNYATFRKGRVVYPFDSYKSIKEWKEPLNIKLVIKYEPYEPPIIEVLKWHNQKQAIQYLRERGLEIKG